MDKLALPFTAGFLLTWIYTDIGLFLNLRVTQHLIKMRDAMKRVLLMAMGFLLLVLSVSLIGCAQKMTTKQSESTRKPQTLQLTDEQAAEASELCQYLGNHNSKKMGFTVSHDVKLDSIKFDKAVTEIGGNSYYIMDSRKISDKPGETSYHVFFDVFRCDEVKH